jgi:hypothetical protein
MPIVSLVIVVSLAGACVVSLAGACVVEEPAGEMVSWSEATEAEIESQAEPDAVWRPSCRHHYECCQDTKLGDKKDGPNMSRCHYCADRCDDEGQWPKLTYGGGDCQYWKKKYKKNDPKGGCY